MNLFELFYCAIFEKVSDYFGTKETKSIVNVDQHYSRSYIY